MHEVEKTSTSLTGVESDLLPLKLVVSLSDRVTHLVKNVPMKNQDMVIVRGSLASTEKELES